MKYSILHTADIQVQVRDKNLALSYTKCLKEIEQKIKDEKIDIYLITGDLFEYAESNDAEKKIMYSHLSRVLSIDTLREVTILAGNHDLVKAKHQKENEVDENSINTFAETIKALSDANGGKLTYLKYSKPTESHADSRLVWLPYSLEDGLAIKGCAKEVVENLRENGKCVVTLYHDILREYVDETKLPVQKQKYDSICGMDDFHTPIIIAGDIHLNWCYNDEKGKLFYYCGSPIQRNFGEGSYFKVGVNGMLYQNADKKVAKLFTFDPDSLKITFERDIELTDYVAYNTIETLTSAKKEDLFAHLESLIGQMCYGAEQTYVKLKLSNLFINSELEIRTLLYEKTKQHRRVSFDISYDKFINTNASTNVEKILQETTSENEDEIEKENNINLQETPTLDNLVLTDVHLKKLFTYVLDERMEKLSKEIDSKETLQSVYGRVMDIFTDELNNCITRQTKLNIELQSVKCNAFMSLGENEITINAPGITRISATNAVGKTTLFHMLRWAITGELYEGMSKNQTKKNTLLVFNNHRPDIDDLYVVLNMQINNSQIKLTRTASRTWKRNITEEQKLQLEWREFIQNVSMNVELQIVNLNTNEEKKYVGDQAQNCLDSWFANAPQTIMFINYIKILQTLKMPSKELNEIILNFIGIDYLEKLENNLPIVKDDLQTEKPKRSVEEITSDINQKKELISGCKENLEKVINEIKEHQEKLELLQKASESINNKLVEIGNIPLDIQTEKTLLEDTRNKIAGFVKRERKEMPKFECEKPAQPSFDEVDEDLKITEAEIENIKNSIEAKSNFLSEKATELRGKYMEALSTVEVAKDKYIQERNALNAKITELNQQIIHKNEEVKSGICPTCKRPYDDALSFEEKKERLIKEIKECNLSLSKVTESKNKIDETLTLVNVKLTGLKTYYEFVASSMFEKLADETNETRIALINTIVQVKNETSDLEKKKVDHVLKFENLKNEKEKKQNTYVNDLNAYNKRLSDYNSECDSIRTYNDGIDEYNKKMDELKYSEQELGKRIAELQLKLPEYEETTKKRDEINDSIKLRNMKINSENESKTRISVELNQAENDIQKLQTEYDNCVKYKINNIIYKMYQQLIANDFKHIVFEYYRNFLNNSLNDLLDDVNFKLFFNNDSELYMIDLKNSKCVYTPCQQVSGMESVFMGLSLIYMMSVLNMKNNINLICIDELSGQLNNGKNLSYDAPNYCELFVKILSKFKEKNILIVDHQIDDMNESLKYEVKGTSQGGKYFIA